MNLREYFLRVGLLACALLSSGPVWAQTEPVRLSLLGTTDLVVGLDGDFGTLRTDGPLLFGTDGKFLTIIDFADPSKPTLRSKHPVDGGQAIEVGHGMAYVATTSQVQIIDVQDSSAPTLQGLYGAANALNADESALRLVGSTLFWSRSSWNEGSTNWIEAVDVSVPTHPVRLGTYTHWEPTGARGRQGAPLEARGSLLYYLDPASNSRVFAKTARKRGFVPGLFAAVDRLWKTGLIRRGVSACGLGAESSLLNPEPWVSAPTSR